jgi:UDP-glucose 4-epimerase
MRCFVTGASGHLGVALTYELLRQGQEVAVLLRPSSLREALKEALPQLTVIEGDLTRVDDLFSALEAFKPNIAFHLAWFGVANRFKDDPRQINQNLQSSLRLMELCAAAGCHTWVGLGSQAEYGRVDGVLSEDLPALPETTYGVVKHAVGSVGEKLAAALEMRFVWLRLLATYGPHDDPDHLIPFVVRSMLEGKVPELTAGEQIWDYLYVEDAARALWCVAEQSNARGIFNLGSGQGRTVASIVEYLRGQIDPSLSTGLSRKPYAPQQIMHLQANIERLQAVTGWQPTTSLEEGLAKTVAWYREHLIGVGA